MKKFFPVWLLASLAVSAIFVGWTLYTFHIGKDNLIFQSLAFSKISISDLTSVSGLATGLFSAIALGLAVWAIILQKQSIQTDIDSLQIERLEGNLTQSINDFSLKFELMKKNLTHIRSLATTIVNKDDFTACSLIIDEYAYIRKIRSDLRKSVLQRSNSTVPVRDYSGKYIPLPRYHEKICDPNLYDSIVIRLWIAVEELESTLGEYESISEKLYAKKEFLAHQTSLDKENALLLIKETQQLIRDAELMPCFDLEEIQHSNTEIQRYRPVDDALDDITTTIEQIAERVQKFDSLKESGDAYLSEIGRQIRDGNNHILILKDKLSRNIWKNSRQEVESIINMVETYLLPNSRRFSQEGQGWLPYMEQAASERGFRITSRIDKFIDKKNQPGTSGLLAPGASKPIETGDTPDGSSYTFRGNTDAFILFGFDYGLFQEFWNKQTEDTTSLKDLKIFMDFFSENEHIVFKDFSEYVEEWCNENPELARSAIENWSPSEAIVREEIPF